MAGHPDPPPGSAPTPARRPRIRQRLRTPLEARLWRRRAAGYTIGALAFILIVNALVGENGYLATMQAARAQSEVESSLARARRDNQEMRDRIIRLKNDLNELEGAARRDLHLSKPGETMIVIKDAPQLKPTPTPKEPGR